MLITVLSLLTIAVGVQAYDSGTGSYGSSYGSSSSYSSGSYSSGSYSSGSYSSGSYSSGSYSNDRSYGDWGDGSSSWSSTPDKTPPTVTAFTVPASATTLAVVISSFTATDNIGVTGYLVNESATAPAATAGGWTVAAPKSYVFATAGSKTLYAWAKDAAGNVSASRRATVIVTISDKTAPTVTAFTVPASAATLAVPINSFSATDNVGVTGYLVTESSLAPLATAGGWTAAAPTTYSFATAGNKTLYAWAKDQAGNVSAARTASVTIILADTTPPTVTAFTVPASAATLAVPISSFSATDNVGVTGYLVTESSLAPLATAGGWTATAPTIYSLATAGSKTLYAWAKDQAGNVSAARTASVTITLADTTPPTVTAFTVPASAATLAVPTSSFSATDDVGVTGYLVTETSIAPLATAGGWTATAPASYSFATAGSKTLYAWAKDQAGNVSAARTASVTITLADTTPPTVTAFTVPASTATLAVPISSFSATDNVGVTGYLVTETSIAPLATAAGWTATAPITYSFATAGSKTLYAWAKDQAGNVSAARTASVTITLADTTPPTVTAFTVPVSAATLAVPISSFSATDNVGVTGYLVTETSIAPLATAGGWTATAPASYSFATAGSKTLYAWAKDQAGNVSAGRSANITIALPQGEPVLIVSSASNPFSGYYAEILRTEGMNAFSVSDSSSLSPTMLAAYDLVILGEMPLTTTQVTMLSDWVNSGGNLIAMRPDKKLAGLLGLTDNAATLSNAYLFVDTAAGPGVGIVNDSMQFHGTADRYALNGATSLANLYSTATTATSSPAVTLRRVGSGQAAAFAYDLARSVVYTRQGNPEWAGQDRDGLSPNRSNDLFYGAASFDPQPDWVDFNKIAIPQADEQQRLLANLIIQMNMAKKPLPRFWYLPRSLPAAVVMTGDDHGNGNGTGATAERFDSFLAVSPPGCSVENWECVRGTSYVYNNVSLSEAQASAYNAAGFETALHVSSNCANWTPESLESFYSDQLAQWRAKYFSLPTPVTNRTHCIAWSDYVTQPKVELAHGIRFDTNYYFFPPSWVVDRPGLFSGSGMPMRFAEADGSLIDVYQAVTQMTDESGQSYPATINALLDRAVGPQGYYGVFTVNAHTDVPASAVSDAIVQSAKERGIPVVSARQMLQWLDGRNASTIEGLSWNGNILNFSITAAQGAHGLTAMVPVPKGQAVTRLTAGGTALPFTQVSVKGMQYARFMAATGAYQVEFSPDSTPPQVKGVTPSDGASDIDTVAPVTISFSELLDPASVTGSTFELRDSANLLVPAQVSYDVNTKTAVLQVARPLAISTRYTATVKGGADGVRDLSGNPLPGDVTWSFTTTATPQSFSLWSGTAVPGVTDSGPDDPVELGVKFRADSDGQILGIRFYKGSNNTGIHVGNLWTSTGTLLATATFSNETASGWQQVNFPTPVPVSANTVYVASYHASSGHFSFDHYYFAGKGVDNPPLHALADGVSGANGVFAYGGLSSFPNESFLSSNYWVDVVFQP